MLTDIVPESWMLLGVKSHMDFQSFPGKAQNYLLDEETERVLSKTNLMVINM